MACTLTEAYNNTCEGRPGSKGYEALDAATYVRWGARYVKSDDRCASAQDFPTASGGVPAHGRHAGGHRSRRLLLPLLRVAGLARRRPAPGRQLLARHQHERSRLAAPHAEPRSRSPPPWRRPFAGPSLVGSVVRGWRPDRGHDRRGAGWPAQQQERFPPVPRRDHRLTAPLLLLSFDARTSNASSTLGLLAPSYYLNVWASVTARGTVSGGKGGSKWRQGGQ